jgi:ATP-dependent RNA helicase RhlE
MTFSSLGLSESLLCAVKEQGYDKPTPIQAQGIPAVLKGNDIMAAAQTGTGKTASFTLPLLQRLSQGRKAGANQARALVLTPTRELAAQVESSITTYGKYLPLTSTVVFGGVKINPQMMRLRKGVDILVATPGRLLDLYQQNAVKFDHLEVLILDEADRMLDMGFIHDIRKIISFLPSKRQNLLFSATFSGKIRTLAEGLLQQPVMIEVSPRNTAAKTVKQAVFEVDKSQKTALLSHLVRNNNWQQVLVFMRTKHGANRLVKRLDNGGVNSAAIHGNKTQGARTRALADFKSGKIRVLVATDIAARGIDIVDLPHVVNFELPNISEDYIHRIGRTGRAGSEGEAISLVSADEVGLLQDIENLIGQTLVREQEIGFVPSHNVPLTQPNSKIRRKKPKKPKKNKQLSSRENTGSGEKKQGQKKRVYKGKGGTEQKKKSGNTKQVQKHASTDGKSRRGLGSKGIGAKPNQ